MALLTTQVVGGDTIDQVRLAANAIIVEAISGTDTGDQAIPFLAAGQCTTILSASAVAVAGFHYFINTATQTLTLPASPTKGEQVKVTVGNFVDTVISRNGAPILGIADNFTIDVAYMGLTFIYVDNLQGWVIL